MTGQCGTVRAFDKVFHPTRRGYAGDKLKRAFAELGQWPLEIVKRCDTAQGFRLLPRRWVVEATFAWLNRCRRFEKDNAKPISFQRPHRWKLNIITPDFGHTNHRRI